MISKKDWKHTAEFESALGAYSSEIFDEFFAFGGGLISRSRFPHGVHLSMSKISPPELKASDPSTWNQGA